MKKSPRNMALLFPRHPGQIPPEVNAVWIGIFFGLQMSSFSSAGGPECLGVEKVQCFISLKKYSAMHFLDKVFWRPSLSTVSRPKLCRCHVFVGSSNVSIFLLQ